MIDETALALEGVRLRRRELATLRQMQNIRQKADLRGLLNNLLESVHQTLESDASVLIVKLNSSASNSIRMEIGEIQDTFRPVLDGIMQGVTDSRKPIMLGNLSGDLVSIPRLKSILATPLINADQSIAGAILVGSRRTHGFNQRQLALLQTVAGQLNLVIQNSSMASTLEFQAIMDERRRLAREIHDGLAQTLGFLKLQAAQLKQSLVRGDYERIRKGMDQYYDTLSEAYQDARQAIDGLRIGLDEDGLRNWLHESLDEFQEISGIETQLRRYDSEINLPPEINVQLMRILQESLSNIRKHAEANRVLVNWFEDGGDYWLEVQDDGLGFLPEEVAIPSRHGLRGMYERAELIGADFQVISQPGAGTTIRVRLPLRDVQAREVSL
jgi:two-component system nitrate/nitrite sensor histidine kinase NarX